MCLRLQLLAGAAEGSERWRKAQREDSDLAPIVQWLEASGELPSWEVVVAPQSPATKCLVDQWETLRLNESGVLEKRWVVFGGTHSDAWLVVVPRAFHAEMLKELHPGVTRGHLGVKKILYRLRQRFYWVGMWSNVSECDMCSAKKDPARRNRASLQVYCVWPPWNAWWWTSPAPCLPYRGVISAYV